MPVATAQTPMSADDVFGGEYFRTNHGHEGTWYYFRGHLTDDQIAERYFEVYPEHRDEFPYTVDRSTVEHAWHVFTLHEDTCYLIDCDDPADPFTPADFRSADFCTCEALQSLMHDGPGYEYRHPHPADADTRGAIAVTWADIAPA